MHGSTRSAALLCARFVIARFASARFASARFVIPRFVITRFVIARLARALLLVTLLRPGTLPAQNAPCPRAHLPAYAHNDYANLHPLTDALALGYRGVEADVFLVDGALRVGHDRRHARRGKPFESLYLEPLAELVRRCRSVTGDRRPFFLAIEIKEPSPPAYAALVALLARYATLFVEDTTPAHPAVDVVLVGWTPTRLAADSDLGLQYRMTDAVPPAPGTLDKHTRLVSIDYGKTMGRWWTTATVRRRWLAAIRAARASAPDLVIRVHNVPADARVYAMLLDAGVDLIGTKTLGVTERLLTAAPAR